MTIAHIAPFQGTSIPVFIQNAFRREPLFAGTTVLLILLAVPLLAASTLEQRTLFDINVWIKPLKFDLALIVYLGTMAWFATWLPESVTDARWYKTFSFVVVAAVALEMVWIVGAAANGIESHFNSSTPFMAMLYPIMGGLAVILTSATLVYGVVFLRDEDSVLTPAFRLSLAWGLILTFGLTVSAAGLMVANNGHFVGGNLSDAEGWPLMGWATDGGDLRVPHFFATHAMHFIPAFGFVAGTILPNSLARMSVTLASAGFAGFVVYTAYEALNGIPFLGLIL